MSRNSTDRKKTDGDGSKHTKSADSTTTTAEFGGALGSTFFTLALPLGCIFLFIACNEHQCSFVRIPKFEHYTSISTFIHLPSILAYNVFAILVGVFQMLPFGGETITIPTKRGNVKLVMNGAFSIWISCIAFFFLFKMGFPISQFITSHLLHFLVAAIISGTALTLYVHIRSFYHPTSDIKDESLNQPGICAFFLGREINPTFLGVDLKFYVMRLCLITALLIDISYLCEQLFLDLENGINVKLTLLVLCIFRATYFIDPLVHEKVWLTSYEIRNEGFGYMDCCGYPVYTFMVAAQTKYMVDYGVSLPIWVLALVGLLFGIGYVFFRGANNEKHIFRTNPRDPKVSHLKTLETQQGNKLLISGFWGLVRHPNYFGDIMMNLACIPFSYNVPPVITNVAIILLLIHRTTRDQEYCKQKYGNDWKKYCKIVKYKLVPYIY